MERKFVRYHIITEDKNSIPRYTGPKDNFLFWAARVKAILAEKEIDETIEWPEEKVPSTDEEVKKGKKACSIVLRGLGDIPTAVVIRNTKSAQKTWSALHKRFASKSTFHKPKL